MKSLTFYMENQTLAKVWSFFRFSFLVFYWHLWSQQLKTHSKLLQRLRQMFVATLKTSRSKEFKKLKFKCRNAKCSIPETSCCKSFCVHSPCRLFMHFYHKTKISFFLTFPILYLL